MYDHTIAGEQQFYSITVTSTPNTVYTLMASADKLAYDAILTHGLPVQSLQYSSYNTEVRYRVPVDGYIVCSNSTIYVSSSSGSAFESVDQGTQYQCPIYFWPHKTWVSAPVSGSVTARVYFS